jgi:ABC-type ATPase with predicted acetyltransferase domain
MLTNETDVFETYTERTDAAQASFPMLNDMFVEPGAIEDWHLLHDLHYKAEKLPLGPRFWKTTLYGETIGVMVTGVPKGLLKERHLVMPNLKISGSDTRLVNTQRYVWVNANIRVISRFVFDTMYRGIGAGYRMMNLATRMEGPTYMEIQSSMSKFNLFGQKAGFRFVAPQNANKFEAGMKFFRLHFEANPQDFEAIVQEIESKTGDARESLIAACRAFYLKNSALENTGSNRGGNGARRVEAMSVREVVKAIQQVSLASPLYGVFKNPDKGRALPKRIPLSAFDLQKPNEAFNVDGLRL